jgi:hypothetical protein
MEAAPMHTAMVQTTVAVAKAIKAVVTQVT